MFIDSIIKFDRLNKYFTFSQIKNPLIHDLLPQKNMHFHIPTEFQVQFQRNYEYPESHPQSENASLGEQHYYPLIIIIQPMKFLFLSKILIFRGTCSLKNTVLQFWIFEFSPRAHYHGFPCVTLVPALTYNYF